MKKKSWDWKHFKMGNHENILGTKITEENFDEVFEEVNGIFDSDDHYKPEKFYNNDDELCMTLNMYRGVGAAAVGDYVFRFSDEFYLCLDEETTLLTFYLCTEQEVAEHGNGLIFDTQDQYINNVKYCKEIFDGEL